VVELAEQHTLQPEQGLSVVVERENNVATARFGRPVLYLVALANIVCLWPPKWLVAGSKEYLRTDLVAQERASRIAHRGPRDAVEPLASVEATEVLKVDFEDETEVQLRTWTAEV
jgi:hypothetical protein